MSESDIGNANEIGELGRVVVLNRDVFFGVKIGNQLRSLGYEVAFVKDALTFAEVIRAESRPMLGIIDMNTGVDWDLIRPLMVKEGPGVPILAFGSHLDVEGRRAAKAAGVTRVLSNGDFHRDMVSQVRRYATNPNPS